MTALFAAIALIALTIAAIRLRRPALLLWHQRRNSRPSTTPEPHADSNSLADDHSTGQRASTR
jgi:hypothetical protein